MERWRSRSRRTSPRRSRPRRARRVQRRSGSRALRRAWCSTDYGSRRRLPPGRWGRQRVRCRWARRCEGQGSRSRCPPDRARNGWLRARRCGRTRCGRRRPPPPEPGDHREQAEGAERGRASRSPADAARDRACAEVHRGIGAEAHAAAVGGAVVRIDAVGEARASRDARAITTLREAAILDRPVEALHGVVVETRVRSSGDAHADCPARRRLRKLAFVNRTAVRVSVAAGPAARVDHARIRPAGDALGALGALAEPGADPARRAVVDAGDSSTSDA